MLSRQDEIRRPADDDGVGVVADGEHLVREAIEILNTVDRRPEGQRIADGFDPAHRAIVEGFKEPTTDLIVLGHVVQNLVIEFLKTGAFGEQLGDAVGVAATLARERDVELDRRSGVGGVMARFVVGLLFAAVNESTHFSFDKFRQSAAGGGCVSHSHKSAPLHSVVRPGGSDVREYR